MYFKQYYLGCLAQASYLIGSKGEAAVVDPERDVDGYINEAKAQGMAIKFIIETHVHADFVSGHLELAERTGATILLGHRAKPAFEARGIHDGEEIRLGDVVLRFLETPGHTPESISVLVIDTERSPEPEMILTGDTLFIGDVGRPDLVGSRGFTPERMASMLYDSLRDKIMSLPDTVLVYPAHGAGSLCGRNLSTETYSTIGEQRKMNYALKPMSKEAFVRMTTTDLPEIPEYFLKDVEMNIQGARPLAEIPLPSPLTPLDVLQRIQEGAIVLDTRTTADFGTAHIAGAIHIGLSGQFAPWSGAILKEPRSLVIHAQSVEKVREAVMRLARVGIERVVGYVDGGILAWERANQSIKRLPQVTVQELEARRLESPTAQIVDVRRPAEFVSGHVPGAQSVPLDRLETQMSGLDRKKPTFVICASGYRSSLGCSLLERAGFEELYNIVGGTSAWTATGLPLETARAA